MIDDYFQELQAVISASPAVHSSNVTFDKRSAHIGFVRGDLAFPDGSRLHFREFVNTENVVERYIYAYHYQRADGSLIFRYDNTPHFPDLPNFPHHKHESEEAHVVSADAPDLAAVLKEIELRVAAD